MKNHVELMNDLTSRHKQILDLIAGNGVHYLDIPIHGNTGDLLIYHGTLAFMRRHSIKIISRAAYFHKTKKPQHGEVIVFHGGGNFGDLYPYYQRFRERVINENPNTRIIILPQSIHFTCESAFHESARTLRNHNDLHLFVRDKRSFDIGKKITANTYLAPDMAHQLWPISYNRNSPATRKMFLIRTDNESTGTGENPSGHIDWKDINGYYDTIALNFSRAGKLLKIANLGMPNLECALWDKASAKIIHNAIDYFSEFSEIETDRLHGHILGCLMSIPTTVRDNTYGKLSQYCESWTSPSDIVKYA